MKLIPYDQVTFAPGTGSGNGSTSERWEYRETWNIDFGGIFDKQGRAVGYQITIFSPDLTAIEYPDLPWAAGSIGKWSCIGHYTRDGKSFGGPRADNKFLDDQAGCVAHAKRMLAKVYKASIAKYGRPKLALCSMPSLAERVARRYDPRVANADEEPDAGDIAVEQCEIAIAELRDSSRHMDKKSKAKAVLDRALRIEKGQLLKHLKPKRRASVVDVMRARAKL